MTGTGANGITVDVLDRALSATGSGPITSILRLTYRYKLNAAGGFIATMPHTDAIKDLLVLKKSFLAFYVDGTHEFTGLLEDMTVIVGSDGARLLRLEGRCMLAELAEAPVGFLDLSSASAGINDAPNDIITEANTFTGQSWTLDTTTGYNTTSTNMYGQLAGESALQSLVMVAEHIGEHFRIDTDGTRNLIWLRTDQTDSGIRAVHQGASQVGREDKNKVCYVTNLTEQRTGYQLYNRIYPYGGGNGESRLTLAATSKAAPANYTLSAANNYIESDDSITDIGQKIGRHIQFREIRPVTNTDTDLQSAADELFNAALAHLQRHDDSDNVASYTLDVVGLPIDAYVGDTIRVNYTDVEYSLDSDLVIMEIVRTVDRDGRRFERVIVGANDRLAKTESEVIASNLEQGVIFSAQPMQNGNSYTTGYRMYVGEDQTTDKAEMRFWLGDEVVIVHQVLIRFNLTEIISHTATTAGSTQTSATGGVGNHAHGLEVTNQASSPVGEDLYADDTVGLNRVKGGGGTTTLGTTSLTNTDHTHDVDVDAALSTTYGIFREAAGNTFAIGDLEYRVNSGSWANLNGATSLGSDWYELDITSDVRSATTFRPSTVNNTMEIRRKSAGATGKTAMIDALLSVRTTIQSIAYS